MIVIDKIYRNFKLFQNRLVPIDKGERKLFFQDVAYDNFTRLFIVALAYFIFEAWVLISTIGRENLDRYVVIVLTIVYASAVIISFLYRKGMLRLNGTLSQMIVTLYCVVILSRGLFISVQSLSRGSSIIPLILSLTITSAFFYRRVLVSLIINISASAVFVYNLIQTEWPLRPGTGPGPRPGAGEAMQGPILPELHFLEGPAMLMFNDVMLITLVTCFLAVIVVELRLKVFRENMELLGLSKLDSMTKLLNHINIYEALSIEAERSIKTQLPLTIVMLDIDFFKNVNDNHGHTVGDKIILRISEILKEHIRDSDYVGRYGGEEFMLVLTNTDYAKAEHLCERIRSVIEHCTFINDISITVSLGISQFDLNESPASVVERADKALYRAKENGRNRIEIIV